MTSHSSALALLGAILAEARALIGRSPEQVAGVVGIAGKTIRRLEAGVVRRPHGITLDGLASFYALDPDVLHQLVTWVDLPDDQLLRRLRQLEGAPADADLEAIQIAMRVARRGPEGELPSALIRRSDPDVQALVEDFLALDRRRRTMARVLLQDLRLLTEHERRVTRAS